ncbi:MAG: arginine deiminase family protein [Candidatus Omnitrophica bacterium]|jgi:N-dimethylarginine dimethylaminohydrolase|nr:arginine deiminase family protein [Candidatus Omnitrophota bacterium]MDD3274748.1 arginine deiminase family protein [Candidatus Omnitrophota bacterium]MDD5078363.1 arginine deiminase family protein [Candidatus Omnitrophota bacterium]MDD5725341.1 arginine deiminase family protein [Candidatus Omnitrophota bacterium]
MHFCFSGSEYLRLKTVLLSYPAFRTGKGYSPGAVLHLRKADPGLMREELRKITLMYERFGIKVCLIGIKNVPAGGSSLFNLMFTRDLFFISPRGAVVSRMASLVRRGEVRYARKALRELGIPLKPVIRAPGAFEGADALWINPETVAVGVGGRTNEEGFRQFEKELNTQGIRCLRLPAPKASLHLLGSLQIVDKNLALVRSDSVAPGTSESLKNNRFRVIKIRDNEEIREKQAFNFTVIAPRRIIMPAGCPRTKRIFARCGIRVEGVISVRQLVNAGGGLACATGILLRSGK